MATSLETLRSGLNKYPNSFSLKGHEELVYPKLDAMLQKLLKEEDDCAIWSTSLRTHYVCSVKNLKAFVLFKFNRTAEAFRLLDDVLSLSKGRNVIGLANRGLMTLDSGDPSDALDTLASLQQATPMDLLLAKAEMAFAYRKMGPRYNAFCRDSYDKLLAEIAEKGLDQCDPNFCQEAISICDEFRVFWCYDAAVAIDRALGKNLQTNFNCFDVNKNGDPEKLLRRGCELLKYCLERRTDHTKVWIKYVEIYKKYKQIDPKRNRTLKLQWLTAGNVNVWDCLENAVADVEMSHDHDALMRLGRLFLSGPRANFQLAKHYLYKSLMIRESEFAHHQLSRAFTMELDNSKDDFVNNGTRCFLQIEHRESFATLPRFTRSNSVQHIYDYYKRSPNDFRLEQAIYHIKRANDLAGESSCMILSDLARCVFRYCDDPAAEDTQRELFGWLRQALSLKSSTKGDRAKAYMQMGMIKELVGDRERSKLYLKKSIEVAAGSRSENFPSLPVLLEILREEISVSTNAEELRLYETVQKIGKSTNALKRQSNKDRSTVASESMLNYIEGKMMWFKGRGMIQEALVSLKLLMSMRDLCAEEREFAINLCLEAEDTQSAKDGKELHVTENNFQELFATSVKPIARENLENLCAQTEQIVKTMKENGEKSDGIYAEVMSQLLKVPGVDESVVEDLAAEAEQVSSKMEDTVVVDIQYRLLCNLLKSSFSSHHDILVYSCDVKEDKQQTEILVAFLENGLGLADHCCWAQRDLVHNCGGEYEVYMTKALCRSTRVLVHVTPQLLEDKMDVRILTSVLNDTHERAYGQFIMVEVTGNAELEFPNWCRRGDSSVISLPSLKFDEKEQIKSAKRKLMKALLLGTG
ncbi:uncharacterized protein LOC135495079 [Lineus longissimus]|uniref:uncharacterized protein LOC135495079 n=1 Tax=Lineus longissimus TaxID=88925 RepID=UPI002B4DFB56